VALARAIALDPMLIMYDEPFAGLDPISLGVIGQLIRKLNDALGATTIMVTHDIQESLLIVDYIYFMSDGKVVALGTPDEIRASKDPFVHQFVHAEADGPVPFHYPAAPLAQELLEGGVHEMTRFRERSVGDGCLGRVNDASGAWVCDPLLSSCCCTGPDSRSGVFI
jgi:phospholipid/cholesterol/gamma-HCH transport system ATP-binding protein